MFAFSGYCPTLADGPLSTYASASAATVSVPPRLAVALEGFELLLQPASRPEAPIVPTPSIRISCLRVTG